MTLASIGYQIREFAHKKNWSAHTFVAALGTLAGLYEIPAVHDVVQPWLAAHPDISHLVLIAAAIYGRYAIANVVHYQPLSK